LFAGTINDALSSSGDGKGLPWVKFNYHPCPDTPPASPKADCDTWEACVAVSANCFYDTTCSPAKQLAVSKFVKCFEDFPGHKEATCTPATFSQANATRCAKDAGLDAGAIGTCFKDAKQAGAALNTTNAYCNGGEAAGLQWFPWVVSATHACPSACLPACPPACLPAGVTRAACCCCCCCCCLLLALHMG
jgi:hypothetical protein